MLLLTPNFRLIRSKRPPFDSGTKYYFQNKEFSVYSMSVRPTQRRQKKTLRKMLASKTDTSQLQNNGVNVEYKSLFRLFVSGCAKYGCHFNVHEMDEMYLSKLRSSPRTMNGPAGTYPVLLAAHSIEPVRHTHRTQN